MIAMLPHNVSIALRRGCMYPGDLVAVVLISDALSVLWMQMIALPLVVQLALQEQS